MGEYMTSEFTESLHNPNIFPFVATASNCLLATCPMAALRMTSATSSLSSAECLRSGSTRSKAGIPRAEDVTEKLDSYVS